MSGGGGIRTHGALARPSVFKTDPFGRSGTPPARIVTERTVRGLSERARRTCQTLTVTTVDAIGLPARSAATAVRACCPRVAFRVFQFARYGAEVAVPISAPSTKNLTVATPDCESLADALIRTVPLTWHRQLAMRWPPKAASCRRATTVLPESLGSSSLRHSRRCPMTGLSRSLSAGWLTAAYTADSQRWAPSRVASA